MEISNALLVALMFVTILSMSVGNVLMTLATIASSRVRLREDWILLSWLLLLLLFHFLLFWNTLSIFSIEEWKFAEFLYIMSGPIFLLFASSAISPPPDATQPGALREHFLEVAKRFFLFLALLQLWKVGTDLFLGGGFTPMSALDAATLAVMLVLVFSRAPRVQAVGTLIAGLLFLVGATMIGLGVGM